MKKVVKSRKECFWYSMTHKPTVHRTHNQAGRQLVTFRGHKAIDAHCAEIQCDLASHLNWGKIYPGF